ncbi:MAG TPA: guanylate kinase [Brevefilum fermentans]|jgi:guanylate kinase|uniref:Guanylate kinase n=1 Tax=Candidatus Brevifilum fermentans TaxID=1986204 RepID=A0A1Y6KAC0_9CHLR|nr:guanylate kinase [Brevefilum fermentans]MDI9565774.1 guanylate kinase [Chloroflexota bacterium]OQB82793.1 MAG: Guanylate kinase [Chloroflexi bacterium ADurb.Bin120]SMX54970.1 Guanylate kinase [Brevefilum fermentans]HOM67492.1 guanylate kinase [Brevefilum fermentans]HPX94871.1 guanylate kinase [Brevefilum fermentans]
MKIDIEIKQPQHTPLLIVISGPSGIGKDAVVKGLRARQLPFHFVVTATSRPPRVNEVNGVDYYFYSKEEFEALIAAGEFFEHAKVYSDYKGVPKSQARQALETGLDVVMRLDFQGAKTVRTLSPDAILIFLTASSSDEWIQRLKRRRSESEEELLVRIQTAKQEYDSLDIFDYIVVNKEGQLDRTLDIIENIITAEHHRVHPRRVQL